MYLFMMLVIVVVLCVICALQLRLIKRLRNELNNRPIGRVISSELTKEGLMIKGEIWDDKVWAKVAGDLPAMSIGFKPEGLSSVEPVMAPKKKGYW